MRLALFAPVQQLAHPEGREALRLARALAARVDLTVYIRPDPLRPPPRLDGIRLASQERFERDSGARAFDHVLYFLADDAFTCGYVAQALDTEERNVPGGVVLLREASMQHHFQTSTLYLGHARAFEEGMAHSHGTLGERAGPLVAYGGGHEMMFRQHDVLRSYLESSSLVIAPTRDVALRAERQRGQLEAFVRVVPRGVVPADRCRELARRWFPDAPEGARRYVVSVGELPLDRRDARAVATAILEADPSAWVVLAGRAPRDGEPVHERACWRAEPEPDAGNLPDVDGVIDLREPTPGSVLVSVLRWATAGVPLWVAEHPAYAELDPDQPVRVRPDQAVSAVLRGLGDEAHRARARDGAERVRGEHSVDGEARGILRLLDEHRNVLTDRRVLLGRLWTRLLVEKRRRTTRRLRDEVFKGVPCDLEGFGGDFVADVERELTDMGLGDWE